MNKRQFLRRYPKPPVLPEGMMWGKYVPIPIDIVPGLALANLETSPNLRWQSDPTYNMRRPKKRLDARPDFGQAVSGPEKPTGG